MPFQASVSLDEHEKILNIAKAIKSEYCLMIIEMLNEKSYNMYELSNALNIPFTSVMRYINILKKADIIFVNTRKSSKQTIMKTCSMQVSGILITLSRKKALGRSAGRNYTHVIPIGSYSKCNVMVPCGLWSESGIIYENDNPMSFFHEDRANAELIAFSGGFLEYTVINECYNLRNITAFEISFESCSEAPNYRMDWPSDITVWVNGFELGTWTCPSDFGNRAGSLNPAWWPKNATQYGILKVFSIDLNGSYIDENKCSDKNVDEYGINGQLITVRIGIKDDALHYGGLNLFGKKFGDHPQNIIVKLFCDEGQ